MNLEKLLIKGMKIIKVKDYFLYIQKFMQYLEFYMLWNEKINLSAIKKEKGVIVKHFLDSIASINIIKTFISSYSKIIDLGSGAGFPGIPIKIIKSQWNIDISEVNKKKINFIKKLLNLLCIDDVNIIDSSQNKIKKEYDIVISRAFGPLNKNISEAKKYLKKTNKFIVYKAKIETIKDEINKFNINYHYNLRAIDVPFLGAERHLLIFDNI